MSEIMSQQRLLAMLINKNSKDLSSPTGESPNTNSQLPDEYEDDYA